MGKCLSFIIILLIPSQLMAFGGLFRRNTAVNTVHQAPVCVVKQAYVAPYVQPYVQPTYIQPVYAQTIVQEKLTIPLRETKLSEVKGLRVVQDLEGNNHIEVNGKLIGNSNTIRENIIEKVEKDRIIIEKTVIQ